MEIDVKGSPLKVYIDVPTRLVRVPRKLICGHDMECSICMDNANLADVQCTFCKNNMCSDCVTRFTNASVENEIRKIKCPFCRKIIIRL